jgi:folylpolyglutamate synthase/dihydrofolate synthase
MNYQSALEFVHGLERFGSKPGLERITELLRRVGNPHMSAAKKIHIAGTNGKGSVSAFCASALALAGRRTGLFTSPFVLDFRERIQISGVMISEDDFAAVAASVRRAMKETPQLLITEFEFITVCAFVYFARQECDAIVLEVGMGGRLDATNVVTPDISVITKIDLDHTAVLGDTIEKIAVEKAGIIKPNVPCVCYPEQEESVLELLKTKDPALVVATKRSFNLSMLGGHQQLNASTAFVALELLGFSEADIAAGIERVSLPARQEVLRGNPLVILDGGHNPNGVSALANTLRELKNASVMLVMGMLQDKDYKTSLSIIAPLAERIWAVDVPNPRTLSAEDFAAVAGEYCGNVVSAELSAAVREAVACAKAAGGVAVICGSLYLAAEVREYI